MYTLAKIGLIIAQTVGLTLCSECQHHRQYLFSAGETSDFTLSGTVVTLHTSNVATVLVVTSFINCSV